MKFCIFCRIIAGELPCSKVYEDSEVIAFLDLHPINPGHTLIIPKVHCQSLTELSPELFVKVSEVGQNIAKHLKKVISDCEGISLSLADGEVAGQEVPHVHLHVIPRRLADGFGWKYPASYGQIAERAMLDQLAKSLSESLNK